MGAVNKAEINLTPSGYGDIVNTLIAEFKIDPYSFIIDSKNYSVPKPYDILLNFSRVIEVLAPYKSSIDKINFKLLSNPKDKKIITAEMINRLYWVLTKYLNDMVPNSNITLLLTTFKEFSKLCIDAKISRDLIPRIVLFIPIRPVSAISMRKAICIDQDIVSPPIILPKDLPNSVPIAFYLDEIELDNNDKRNHAFYVDSTNCLFVSGIISRFDLNPNPDFRTYWDEKRWFETKIIEIEILPQIFRNNGFEFINSGELDQVCTDLKLPREGEIDGIAFDKANQICYVIEYKTLKLPNYGWINKIDLSFVILQIKGIIDGLEVKYKFRKQGDGELKKALYERPHPSGYTISSKTQWLKLHLDAILKGSEIEAGFKISKYVPMIITDILLPICNPLDSETLITSLYSLRYDFQNVMLLDR